MMAKRIVLAGCMALALPSTATAADKSVGVLPQPKTTENVLGPVPSAPSFAAWDAFSQGLKDMWPRMYEKVAPRLRDDPQARKEIARLMLAAITQQAIEAIAAEGDQPVFLPHIGLALNLAQPNAHTRTEERRGGKASDSTCRIRWAPDH